MIDYFKITIRNVRLAIGKINFLKSSAESTGLSTFLLEIISKYSLSVLRTTSFWFLLLSLLPKMIKFSTELQWMYLSLLDEYNFVFL